MRVGDVVYFLTTRCGSFLFSFIFCLAPISRYNADTGESTYEDPTAGASPWTEAWDDDAEVPYWYNEETQESTYENPHIGEL